MIVDLDRKLLCLPAATFLSFLFLSGCTKSIEPLAQHHPKEIRWITSSDCPILDPVNVAIPACAQQYSLVMQGLTTAFLRDGKVEQELALAESIDYTSEKTVRITLKPG